MAQALIKRIRFVRPPLDTKDPPSMSLSLVLVLLWWHGLHPTGIKRRFRYDKRRERGEKKAVHLGLKDFCEVEDRAFRKEKKQKMGREDGREKESETESFFLGMSVC